MTSIVILIIICVSIAFFIIGFQVQSYLVYRLLDRYQKNLLKARQKILYSDMLNKNMEDK